MKPKNQTMTKRQVQNIVKCPYMPEHVMSIESLMTHLNRCKATNKHMFKSCMYNCLHVIPKEKYDEHVENCQDKFKHDCDQSVPKEEEESWQESFMRISQNPASKKGSKFSSDSSPNDKDGWVSVNSSNQGYQYYDYDEYEQSSLYDKQKLMFYRPGYYYKGEQRFYTPVPIVQNKYPQPRKVNTQEPFDNPRDQFKKPANNSGENRIAEERENNRPANQANFSKSQKAPSEESKKISMANQQLSDKDTHSQSSKDNKKSSTQENDLLVLIKQMDISMKIDQSLNQSKDQFGDILALEASMLKKQRGSKPQDKEIAGNGNWSILSELQP